MPKRTFDKGFDDLQTAKLVQVDHDVRLLWVPVALQFIGPPSNPNVVKGFVRAFAQLPPSPLIARAVQAYQTLLEPFGNAFVEPFENHFEMLSTRPQQGPANHSERVTKGDEQPKCRHERVADAVPNKDRHKDKNIYTHSNDLPAGTFVDGPAVLAYAQANGWPRATQNHVEQLVSQNLTVEWVEFIEIGDSIRGRQDLRDPLSYLFGIAKRRAADGSDLAAKGEGDRSGLLQDGQALSFDD